MSQTQLLQLARHGDIQAIITLLNRCLQVRRVTITEASLNENCLELKLVSPKVPNQYKLLPFLRDEISSLGITSIQTVNIHALTDVSSAPAWETSLTLEQDWSVVHNLTDAVVKAKRTYSEESEEVPNPFETSESSVEEQSEIENSPLTTATIEQQQSTPEETEISTETLSEPTKRSTLPLMAIALSFIIGLFSGGAMGYFFCLQQATNSEPTPYSLPQP